MTETRTQVAPRQPLRQTQMPGTAGRPDNAEDYSMQDMPFADMCEWWCRKKHLSKSLFYKRSNITKGAFWNMKHNPDKTPKKTTVFACAIGLRLSVEEAEDLLARTGLTFSQYYTMDSIVKENIRQRHYDIYDINIQLYEHDQALLGSRY